MTTPVRFLIGRNPFLSFCYWFTLIFVSPSYLHLCCPAHESVQLLKFTIRDSRLTQGLQSESVFGTLIMPPSPSPPVLPSSPAVPSPIASSERVSCSESDPSLSSPIQSQPPDREMSPPELVQKPGHIQGLHSLTFNQDFTWFTVATDCGFRIYEVNPFREILRVNFSSSSATDPATAKDEFNGGGGIGQVQLLFRSSILALVGGGDQPQYPPNKLMIWDNHQSNCIANLSFRSDVKAVRLRRDRIFVVLMQKLYVYNFADLKLLHQIETIANPKGLCEVSCKDSIVLVCPGIQKGQIRVENYSSKRTTFITAHGSNIAAVALTQDGMMVATASSKGTLIRVFDTRDGTLLQEVRRGKDRAEIYSIAFSANTKWLGVTSDYGTVHVFGLKHDSGLPQKKGLAVASEITHSPNSPRSPVSLLKGVLPKYFSSEWSVAQFRLLEGCQYIVAFGQEENTVVIVGMDGSFYRCKFDPVLGGDMTQLENCNFLLLPDDPQS